MLVRKFIDSEKKNIQTSEKKNQFLIHLVSTLLQGRMQGKSSLKCGYFIFECVAQSYRFSVDLYRCVHRVDVIILLLVFKEIVFLKRRKIPSFTLVTA